MKKVDDLTALRFLEVHKYVFLMTAPPYDGG